jgi:hypothetical protein
MYRLAGLGLLLLRRIWPARERGRPSGHCVTAHPPLVLVVPHVTSDVLSLFLGVKDHVKHLRPGGRVAPCGDTCSRISFYFQDALRTHLITDCIFQDALRTHLITDCIFQDALRIHLITDFIFQDALRTNLLTDCIFQDALRTHLITDFFFKMP